MRRGGLGLPLASDIQAPAYMSSLTQAIYSKVLPEECSSYRDFMEAFHRVLNSPLSPLDSWLPTDRILIDRAHVKFWCKQSWWADILAGKRIQELEQVQSGRVQALLRCRSSTFNAWLSVNPNPGLGSLLSCKEVTLLLRWKLGLPLGVPSGSKCVRCRHLLDPYGDHLVKCTKNGLYRRHNDVVALLKKLFDQAGYRTRTEVSLPSGQRPADLLVEDWEGQPLAIDVSFGCSSCGSG